MRIKYTKEESDIIWLLLIIAVIIMMFIFADVLFYNKTFENWYIAGSIAAGLLFLIAIAIYISMSKARKKREMILRKGHKCHGVIKDIKTTRIRNKKYQTLVVLYYSELQRKELQFETDYLYTNLKINEVLQLPVIVYEKESDKDQKIDSKIMVMAAEIAKEHEVIISTDNIERVADKIITNNPEGIIHKKLTSAIINYSMMIIMLIIIIIRLYKSV